MRVSRDLIFDMTILFMDELIRLYCRLDALKKNLPASHSINEKYVQEYHAILDELSKTIQLSLEEFRIPNSEMKREFLGGNYITGEKHYSNDKVCERFFLLSKLEALLSYFQTQHFSEEKPTIGFQVP